MAKAIAAMGAMCSQRRVGSALHSMMGRWMKRSVTSSLKPGRDRRASIARNRGSWTTCTFAKHQTVTSWTCVDSPG